MTAVLPGTLPASCRASRPFDRAPSMKILFVLNQLPYPPRNGSTIPSYNYLTGLAKSNEVSLLFVSDLIHQSSLQDLESNRQLVSGFWVTQARKKPTIRRVVNEIAGRSFLSYGTGL